MELYVSTVNGPNTFLSESGLTSGALLTTHTLSTTKLQSAAVPHFQRVLKMSAPHSQCYKQNK